MIRECKCGNEKPELVKEFFAGKNGDYYFYRCNVCGFASGIALYSKLALRNWNSVMRSTISRENFSCKVDSDMFAQLGKRSMELGITKTAFVLDAVGWLLEMTDEWERKKYFDEMYGD